MRASRLGCRAFQAGGFDGHVVFARTFVAKPLVRSIEQRKAGEDGTEALPTGKAKVLLRFKDKLKRFKPVTPSLRHTVLIDKSHLWKGRPINALTKGLRKSGGRNNQGRITTRHRGGGHKRLYRMIDFKRKILDTPGVVQRLEYDPNRSANIALVLYPDNVVTYIIAPDGLKVGDTVEATRTKEIQIKTGNAMTLAQIPIGITFHCMELYPHRGAQVARSAGTECQLLDKDSSKKGYGLVAICSKEQRYVPLECMATIGTTSNPVHFLRKLGKAGRNRWLGRRPHVRGVAMNPVDHPMGGGEGKSGGGRPSCSPTGVLAKGFKTRNKKPNPLVVIPRGGIRKRAHK
jgi:large subunit ribosomal protein L2